MRIAALQLAGGILVKLVYVPSEDNPADAPSRGIVRRWRPRGSAIAKTKKQVAAADVLRKRTYKKDRPLRAAQRTLRRITPKLQALYAEHPELA